jgi:hypothetical protein
MFQIPPLPAHGALGWADELIFLGVIVVFLGMMGWSWFRSRGMDYDSTDLMPDATRETDNTGTDEERFQLD